MKTISQHLKQAFNALEFTNAGNLTTLNSMLNAPESSASSARAEQHDASAKMDSSAAATAN